MYHKLSIKIKAISICIFVFGTLVSIFIGRFIMYNNNDDLLGFLVFFIGSTIYLLLTYVISYICDILDKFYYTLKNTNKRIDEKCKEKKCPCCNEPITKE